MAANNSQHGYFYPPYSPPGMVHPAEQVSTLRFATRMMCVASEPAINEIFDPAVLVKKLQKEISHLKNELAMHDTLPRNICRRNHLLNNKHDALHAINSSIDKSKALSLVLHCADISHPAKDWDIHKRWTDMLLDEFFRQGDREQELGLPFSPLCDRKNTLVAESQIGFIDFIVEPSFLVMGDMLDKILSPLRNSSSSHNVDEAITEEVFDKEGSGKKTPSNTLPGKSEFVRPWVPCLVDNKVQWKAIAVKEAEVRRQNNPELNAELEQDGQSKTDTESDTVTEKNDAEKSSKESDKKQSDSPNTPQKAISRQTSTTGLLAATPLSPVNRSRMTSTSGLQTSGISRHTSTSELANETNQSKPTVTRKFPRKLNKTKSVPLFMHAIEKPVNTETVLSDFEESEMDVDS